MPSRGGTRAGDCGVLSADRGRGLGGCRFPAKLCRKSNLGLLRKSSEGGEAKRCQASSFRAPGICILAFAIIDVWHAPALKQSCKSLHEAVQRAGLRQASLAGPSLQFGDDLPPLPNATPACRPLVLRARWSRRSTAASEPAQRKPAKQTQRNCNGHDGASHDMRQLSRNRPPSAKSRCEISQTSPVLSRILHRNVNSSQHPRTASQVLPRCFLQSTQRPSTVS